MKFELVLLIITAFLVYNTYYDGYLVKMIHINKKYLEITGYIFVGLTIYLFIKKHPNESSNMMYYANNIIKYMPIDKSTSSVINPIFDFTQSLYTEKQPSTTAPSSPYSQHITPQMKRMLQSGGNRNPNHNHNHNHINTPTANKRCVSQAKKKYIASQQNWRCGHCRQQLDYTYEVDHVIDLQYGGSNEATNLVALCRNCHGKKTMSTQM